MNGEGKRAGILKKALFYAALLVVFAMAVLPPDGSLKVNDKILHATTFAFLFFLMEGAYGGLAYGVMAACLTAYGVAIETVQFFLPYREFSFLDMVANATGLCAYYAVRRGMRFRRRR